MLFSEGVLYMNTFVVNLQVCVNMVGSRFHCRYCFVNYAVGWFLVGIRCEIIRLKNLEYILLKNRL